MSMTHLCGLHAQDVEAWRGQACGETGWGPGHRLPRGITVAIVDSQVAVMREICAKGTHCGDATVEGLICGSVDH